MDDIGALAQLALRMNPVQRTALVEMIARDAADWPEEMAENQRRGGTVQGDWKSPHWNMDLVLGLRRAAARIEKGWAATEERRRLWNSYLPQRPGGVRDGYLAPLGEPEGWLPPDQASAIEVIDAWIDSHASQDYQDQPLALDWLRTCKLAEEEGESVAELILASGGNPRKPRDSGARDRLLKELADRAWTAVLSIQHFTKSTTMTNQVLADTLAKIRSRVPGEGSAAPRGEGSGPGSDG